MKEKITVNMIRMKSKFIISYTYIIVDNDTKKCMIIDPAWQLENITSLIKRENLFVDCILLTHSHNDHVNLVESLVELYNCKVYISKIEKEYYSYRVKNLMCFDDKTEIHLNNIKVQAIITPGHTKGSTCYLVNNNILFTGDTLFNEGCGDSLQVGGDIVDLFKSIQKLKLLVHEECIIYPGHAFIEVPGKSFSRLQKSNIYLQISKEDIFVKLLSIQPKKCREYI